MRIQDNFQRNPDSNTVNSELNEIGYVQLSGSRVTIGKDQDNFYILHSETGQIVCRATQISDFIHKNRVLWAEIETDSEHDMMINKRGQYLIDTRIANYITSEYPQRVEGDIFVTETDNIKWTGSDFRVESNIENSNKDTDDKSQDKIKKFLEDVDLKFGKPPDRIDDVEAEVPLVEIFSVLGDGDMGDEDFVPPSQDRYAEDGYNILRHNASDQNKEMFTEEYKPDWKGRLRRAWPSLVRDAHFSNKLNKESESFDAVSDEIEHDLKGADAVVVENGTEHHINLFVDSRKSQDYLDHKKENRHDNELLMPDTADDGPVDIAVATNINDGGAADVVKSRNNQDIYLYSDDHVRAIKELIKSDKDKIVDGNGNVLCEVLRK